MKNSSKFLERICKRMRSRRTHSTSKKNSDCKKLFEVGAPRLSSKASAPVDTSRGSVASSDKPTASWSLEPAAGGAFLDSMVPVQTRPSPMAAPPTTAGCFNSLPSARTDRDSHSVAASSAPLLQVQSPGEEEKLKFESSSSRQQATTTTIIPPKTKIAAGNAAQQGKETYMLSATDSGLYSEEEGASEDEYLEVFSKDEDEEDVVDDGWLIPADEVSLDKIVAASNSETVYSGYWHGNVAVHARCSNSDESYRSILADISTLSNIRHESIQLFLGVCHDLHSDYISIVMDQMKGESLHNLIHKQNHKFSFQRLTKIMSQVAQGMEYLHAKGIPHPLLTSHSVTLHFRVCISMLSPGSASMGVVNASDLSYLSPEVMRTVMAHSGSAAHQTGLTCPSSPHSTRGLQSRCSSTTSCRHPSYRLPSNGTGWSTPTSPNLRHSRKHNDSNGYLSPDGPVYFNRGSCDDLRGTDGQCRSRVQLKGDVDLMQTFQANTYSFGTLLYETLTLEKPFSSTHGNLIIYQVGRGFIHSLSSLREGKLKQTISRCWRKDPIARPSFQELLSTFEQNLSPKSCGLKSHFSFSVPNQLDKLGQQDGCGLNC